MRFGKLKDIYDVKNNYFTIISFIMSLMIIYFHSYPLYYGIGTPSGDIFSKIFGYSIGEIVVDSFFIISGFNIYSSLKKSQSDFTFWAKRLFKLLPTLLLCLIITIFVVYPLITKTPFLTLLLNKSIYSRYLIHNIILFFQTEYGIGIMFCNNPYPCAINGSIWTIRYFLFCYIYIYILKKLNILDNKKIINSIIFSFLIANIFLSTGIFDKQIQDIISLNNKMVFLLDIKYFVKLAYFFTIGIFFKQNIDKIIFKKWHIVLMISIWIISSFLNLNNYTNLFTLPYLIIFVGTQKCKTKIPNISYTIYVFGFLIQQIVMHHFSYTISFYMYNFICIFSSIIIGLVIYYTYDKFTNYLEKLTIENCNKKSYKKL